MAGVRISVRRVRQAAPFVIGFLFFGFLLLWLPGRPFQAQPLSPPSSAIPASLFGLHMHRAATTTPWPAVPFATWRLWDAYVAWANLEPRKGDWHFEILDKYVALAEAHRVELLLPLGLSPTWASARPKEPSGYDPGNAAEPKNIADWRDYVRTVATRYKQRIRSYEIWNEPNLKQFFTGSPEQMVTLVREAYKILKEVDPSNTLVSPSATGIDGVAWLDQFLQKGGGDYVDVIGHHFYVSPNPPESMLNQIARAKEVMAKRGVGDKPLWDTETGWLIENHKTVVEPQRGSFSKVLSDDEASGYVARSFILTWAAGVSRFYWYAWDNYIMGLTEADGTTLKPPAKAYVEVQRWLVGARVRACRTNAETTWVCEIAREGGYEGWIVWNPLRRVGLEIPKTWGIQNARDLAGGTRNLQGTSKIEIGPSPLLLERPGR